jgi:hypothetical protein
MSVQPTSGIRGRAHSLIDAIVSSAVSPSATLPRENE